MLKQVQHDGWPREAAPLILRPRLRALQPVKPLAPLLRRLRAAGDSQPFPAAPDLGGERLRGQRGQLVVAVRNARSLAHIRAPLAGPAIAFRAERRNPVFTRRR